MSVAKKILMGSGAVDDYEIEQSLMFATGDTAYLHRTPGSAGNQRTWTWSGWVKRGQINIDGQPQTFFGVGAGSGTQSNSTFLWMGFYDRKVYVQDWDNNIKYVTNRYFRDPSAWYHFCIVVDTTDGTAGDRIKIFCNGVRETSFEVSNSPSEDHDTAINSTNQHRMGAVDRPTYDYRLDAYLAEVHFIDGTALTPTSFGKTDSTTGQWIPKEAAGLTYGTNGFYCKFVSGALGTDSSGEGNNYTAVNLANDDTMKDTPTNNMSTWNPIDAASQSGGTLSQGNLRIASQDYILRKATLYFGDTFISTGKWYWEVVETGGVYGSSFGVTNNFSQDGGEIVGEANKSWYSARYYKDYTATSSTSTGERYSAGNVLGIALDLDNDTIKYYVNNSLENTDSTISASNAMVPFSMSTLSGSGNEWPSSVINFGQNSSFNSLKTRANNADANGYGDFFYSPPSGYLCACSKNLPTPTIKKPTDYVNPVIYTGNGSTQSISGVGFQPDLVWIKNRTAADNHKWTDAVRGATEELESNSTDAEATNADGLTAFASDGFALGDDDEYNTNTENYVSWNWLANGSGSADTSGDIDATVSANATAGFSIVTWTANGSSTDTIPHGLGVAPEIVFYKRRDGTSNWFTWTTAIDGGNDHLDLNNTDAAASLSGYGSLTSTMITNVAWSDTNTLVAYCFASVEGYSKIGSYVGNDSTSGVFVYTGLSPAWLMIKRTDTANTSTNLNGSHWGIVDNKRKTFNPDNYVLLANSSAAADTTNMAESIDLLANGFKFNSGEDTFNGSGTYIYLAFAESPFKYSNAR